MTEMAVVYWPHTKFTSVFVLRMKIIDSNEVSKVQYHAEHVRAMPVRIFVRKPIEFSLNLVCNLRRTHKNALVFAKQHI